MKTAVIAILAGGKSTRMGQDKVNLTVAGETFLALTVRVAQTVTDRVYVVGRRNAAIENVTVLDDDPAGNGPMGGLRAVLKHAKCHVLAIACDLSNLTPDALQWLLESAQKRDIPHGLIVQNGARWEPLFSIYSPACLPILERCLEQNDCSLRTLIQTGNFETITLPAEYKLALTNVNTPEDWKKIGAMR